RQEWEAELRHREAMLAEWYKLDWRNKLDLLRRSLGAFWDALLLQPRRLEDEMFQDLRFGVRMLAKKPGFTLIAVLTLALGIGANTAIFSVVDTVLLKPLPYEDPNKLVMIWEANRELAKLHNKPAPGNFLDLQEQITAFDSVTAWFETAQTLQGEHDAEQVNSVQASVEFFQTLRAQPALGRVFLPGEITGVANDGAGQYARGDRVVVLSDNLWRRRFGADPALVGKYITINGREWQVLGVMPAGFAMPGPRVEMWVPWDIKTNYGPQRFAAGPPRDWRFLSVLARLKSGVTMAQAQSQLDGLTVGLAERFPKTNQGWGMTLTSYYDEVVGASRGLLLALFGAVGMVLLIACANVASMLMARAAGRQREIAVRSALGAARFRLVRQLLTESMLLALLGGAAGLALTYACRNWLVALAPADVPRIEQTAIDWRVLGFTLLIALATGVLFGLIPALKGTQTDLTTALKEGGARGATAGLSQRRFLNAMVVVEIAVALVLLTGAGLFGRSFIRQLQTDPGFDPKNLLTLHITLDNQAYRGHGRAAEYYRQLIVRLQSLPGVVSAAAITTLPMSDVGVDFDRPYWRAGDAEPYGKSDKVSVRMATPEYFKTMGMTLLHGRQFSEQDRPDTSAVLIVNESMAKKTWPNENPIGKQLMLDYNRGKYAYEVIGVTRGIRYYGLKREPQPEVFIPHAQNAYLPMNVVIRTENDPSQLLNAVKSELRALDPTQPGHHVVTMEQLIARSVAADRFSIWLLGLLSALALLLAATGIYSVMAYAVEQRTHEIGVRLALGARLNDVLKLVVWQGLRIALVGVAIGLGGALVLTQWLKNMLYEVSATDPMTFAVVSLLLLGVAVLACWVPARRATQVDPLVALRHE
ncbi:MAG: ABC transporter permease, partial [Acidobacteriota bacterium]